jgi:hypothetical protein
MSETGPEGGLKERLAKQGEDALGKIAQDLLENPFVVGAISRAFDARERAAQAQETAMSALNIPSAGDIERLTRRLRSVSQRMEGIEEAVERVGARLEAAARGAGGGAIDDRLAAIEDRLGRLGNELSHLTAALDAPPRAVHREQSRLEVDGDPAREAASRPKPEPKPKPKPAGKATPKAKATPAAKAKPAPKAKPAGSASSPKPKARPARPSS